MLFLYGIDTDTIFEASNSNFTHMKRLLLCVASCLLIMEASAEIRYQSINNVNGTNIVLVDRSTPQNAEITDAILFNNGKEYPAKEIRCDVIDNVATYRLKFTRFKYFKDCKVTLKVNGENITIDIQKDMVGNLNR